MNNLLQRLRQQVRQHLRLMPAVIALGTLLLGIKSAGLVMEAKAQEQQAPTPSAASAAVAQTMQAATSGSSASDDDPETSSAQVDILTSLSKRRSELDGRERDLDMRENLIAAAEKRVDGKIDSLKQLQSSIQALLVQRDAAEQKELDALVKTYSSMKPKDAARIFDSLDDAVALSVAAQMKPDVLAPILGTMQSDAAQKLTVKLANRLKVPEAQNTQAQQLAATTPLAPAPAAAASTTPAPTPAAAAPATPPAAASAPPAQLGSQAGKPASPPAPAK